MSEFAPVLSLLAVVVYAIALGTTYWLIITPEVFGLEFGTYVHRGLFVGGCGNLDCSTFDAAKYLKHGDVGSKIAAAGVIVAGLCSLIASITFCCSTRNKHSGGTKCGTGIAFFAAFVALSSIVAFAFLARQHDTAVTSTSFGYSLYIAVFAVLVNLTVAVFSLWTGT